MTPVQLLVCELDRINECSDSVKIQIIEGMIKQLIECERLTILNAVRSHNGKCIGDEVVYISQKEAENYYDKIAN